MKGAVHARTPKPVAQMFRGSWASLPERFWSKVAKMPGDDACWEWTAHTDRAGYGEIDKCRAHRMSYYLATGIDPAHLFVCHHCDNPPCVRPSHLFLGSPADNADDMRCKGRATARKKVNDQQAEQILLVWGEGELTHRQVADRFGISRKQAARIIRGESRTSTPTFSKRQCAGLPTHREKLTASQVIEIRERYARGSVSQRALGKEYGVSHTHIKDIVGGRRRAHLGGPVR